MRGKIVVKLFFITIIFFILFITIELLCQSAFFHSFYTNKKTEILKKNLKNLRCEYTENIGDIQKTFKIIKNFENNNNAKVAILENNGLLAYTTDFTEKDRDTRKIEIIKSIIEEWTSNPKDFNNLQRKNKIITYIFNEHYYNVKEIVTICPVNFNNRPGKVIFAVSSLQPVDEAVGVMREFYIYIYIAAIILILILSIIYSKMLTKPLVNINKVALNMAKLDFSKTCRVTSEDEIGNLGKTLNFLSNNLNEALNSLKESNEKLKSDIEREKEIDNMRKEFVASVSHELKTPISLIEGYAEGIKDGIVKTEDMEYYLDVIIDESKKMGNLVSDMLELSKLEGGGFKLKKEPFYLDDIINETIKRLNGINNKENIKIINYIDKKIKVLGDKIRIEEVVTNFLTNALRYTKKNNNIYVRYIESIIDVTIEIENEGEHIKEEELDKIWDRFYKIDKSRNRSLGGTGLGLSIVKNILELHKSNYGASNTEKGAKFYFTLKKDI